MTGNQVVLKAGGSHLYPGARGTLQGAETEGPCLVEFVDGSVAFGNLSGGAGTILVLDPYVTARGTEIPAKRWAVALAAGRFRIFARL
jgi:hypothetical protein